MLPAQEMLDRRRVVALCVVTLLMLCWGRIVAEFWINWNLWAALLPMCAGIAILAYLSPPAAGAFFFLGNYFFGNLSIAFYPRMSFLTVIAAVLLGTLLVVRWQRGELARFLVLPKRMWLALAALVLFFLLGFARAVWEVHTLVADPGHSNSVMAALKESLSGGMRGSNLLSHYMFLSHWLSFLMIGVLACMSRNDLKIFFFSFSILFATQLLAIPLWFYLQFFQRVYVECESLGLGYEQVNRGNLGYMAALASSFALTMAHDRGGTRRILLLAWWSILSGFVFLSGSRGPMAAWLLATAYVVWSGRRIGKMPYGALIAVLLATGSLSAIAGYSVIPCGMTKKFVESRYSVEGRGAIIRDRLASYLGLPAGGVIRLPDGEARRVSAEEAIQYRDGNTHSLQYLAVKAGHPEISLDTWLLGKGFGSATRSVDYENRSFQVQSGSLNILFDLFIETGLVGLSLFAFAATLLWQNFRKTMAGTPSGDSRLLVMGMISMMLVLVVKVSIAAETPTEDLAALVIGLLIGTAGAPVATVRGVQTAIYPHKLTDV